MKIPYFCCIGAELKRYAQDFDFMNQVYLYKVPTDDSIDEVLSEDYFKAISNSVLQDDIVYIYEASAETLHECRFDKQNGHITAVPLASDETLTGAVTSIIHNNLTPNKLLKSDENGKVAASDFSENDFVKVDGSSIMTGPLKFRAGSFSGAIAGGLGDGVSIYKIKADGTIDSEVASLTKTNGFTPGTTNTQNIGSPTLKWKDAHVARIITGIINNGGDLAVPANTTGTLATKADVDLAANSGRMITDQGVWYAKMYAASTVPTGAEYDGKNYADFSQVDSDNNPIIVIYEGQSGAWVQTEIITPPSDYDGYVPITSKIWDIAEQSGQQGGRVLWNHTSKEFTPYPTIISFENAALTGTPTAPTLNANSPSDQIVNKQTLENALVNHGTGRNVGDVFFTMRNDNELNGAVECDGATYNTTDFTGAQSIGALLAAGKVPYVSLSQYATLLSTQGSVGVFGWDGADTTEFRVPSLNDIFVETGTAAQIGDYLPAGLPNITGSFSTRDSGGSNGSGPWNTKTGSFSGNTGTYNMVQASAAGGWGPRNGVLNFNASLSNSIYGNSNTVQPNAVRYRAMVQLATSASDEAVETCTSVLADVADLKDHEVIAFQVPTSANNYTWYRKYADGWVEQGCLACYLPAQSANTQASVTCSLPITMKSSVYHVDCIRYTDGGNSFELTQTKVTRNTSSCLVYYYSTIATSDQSQCAIRVEGMAAS